MFRSINGSVQSLRLRRGRNDIPLSFLAKVLVNHRRNNFRINTSARDIKDFCEGALEVLDILIPKRDSGLLNDWGLYSSPELCSLERFIQNKMLLSESQVLNLPVPFPRVSADHLTPHIRGQNEVSNDRLPGSARGGGAIGNDDNRTRTVRATRALRKYQQAIGRVPYSRS
jgi:hypothetical protein